MKPMITVLAIFILLQCSSSCSKMTSDNGPVVQVHDCDSQGKLNQSMTNIVYFIKPSRLAIFTKFNFKIK